MALTRYIISPLFPSFPLLFLRDILRCFFVSPLFYSRFLTKQREISNSSTVHSLMELMTIFSYDGDSFAFHRERLWRASNPSGNPSLASPFTFARSLENDRLSFYSFKFLVLLLNGDPPWFLSQRIIEGKRWAFERRR